jgi:hypothetical protein
MLSFTCLTSQFRRARASLIAIGLMSALGGHALGQQPNPAAAPSTLSYAAQGWTATDRQTFYTTGQGSHIMPYLWFKALRRSDADAPFAADQLQRYGYLPNNAPYNAVGLPVGFVIDGAGPQAEIGMTCAACHTGQLEYQKDGQTHALRLDGAPANADFQQFLIDLRSAARATLAQPDRFDAFAKDVLAAGYKSTKAQLKTEFAAWVKQYGDFMDASLPTAPWGPGRLDAFGMIFNRVSARDLGVIANFQTANAPVSYPFLWNATRQDHTQWNGGVPNGLYVQGLARNTGEVFGVFADFKPHVLVPATPLTPVVVIGYHNNSARFADLQTLEEKIAILTPPPWPREAFGLDLQLADKGKPLFDANCGRCHGEQISPSLGHAWLTPVDAVGTDPKMVLNAERKSDPGLYLGALMPPPAIGARFTNPSKASDILAGSVVGSLLDDAFNPPIITPERLARSGVWRAIRKDLADLLPNEKLEDLTTTKVNYLAEIKERMNSKISGMYTKPVAADAGAAYESRVLHGIWATAPYLHNGSVPNLWELLTPPSQRKRVFMVGSRFYDPKNVGYVTDKQGPTGGTFLTDPANANGNGNGGHDFGTGLTDDERWAIIEYMKIL